MTETVSRQFYLIARPEGAVTPVLFAIETATVPLAGPGELLVRVIYLSLDGGNRGKMILRLGPKPAGLGSCGRTGSA